MHLKDLSSLKGTVAIIAAAGTGSRMQSDIPKQYLKINRQTILDITLNRFLEFKPVELVVLVVSPQDNYFKHLENCEHKKLIIIEGGETRADSVLNAMRFLLDSGLNKDTPVMVHDAARPCITIEDLEKLSNYYQKNQVPCLLVSPVVDTLQSIDNNGCIKGVMDRDKLVRAFTPQMASFVDLKRSLKLAVEKKLTFTDEASALVSAGHLVKFVVGRSDNIKVTHSEDLPLVEFYLKKQNDFESNNVN